MESVKIEINAQEFYALTHCVSDEDVRYYLKGVFLDVSAGKIVGTDGHILATIKYRLMEGKPESVILNNVNGKWPKPKRKETIAELICDGEVWTLVYKSIGRTGIDRRVFVLEPIDGQYPNWERTTPDMKGVGGVRAVEKYGMGAANVIILGKIASCFPFAELKEMASFNVSFNGDNQACTMRISGVSIVFMPCRIK